MDDEQLLDLLKIVIKLYTKQLATMQILKDLGATQEQFDKALQVARDRVQGTPALASPAKSGQTALTQISGLLDNIRFPEWK